MLSKLKAAYVGSYITYCYILMGFSILQLINDGPLLAWLGSLLSAAPLAIGVSVIMIKPIVARTSEHLLEAHLPILAGLIVSLYGSLTSDTLLPAVLSIVAYLGFLAYTYWYSIYDRQESKQLQIGQPLPEFVLTDIHNNQVSSTSLTGKANVLIFFRGNWCPLCMAQIKEISKQYNEIESLGAQVVLISPQPHKYTQSLANKFDVNFVFMTDKHNQAAKSLGLLSDFGIPTGMQALGYETDAPMPTVVITDANGKVLWKHETDNYRVRPEPETFLDVLRTAG